MNAFTVPATELVTVATAAGAAQVATPPLVVRTWPAEPAVMMPAPIAPAANAAVTSVLVSCAQVPPAVVPSLWKIRRTEGVNAFTVPETLPVTGEAPVPDSSAKAGTPETILIT